jgi:hypothetical protein
VKPMAELVEIRQAEPDLIDRIADALPEDLRAEYYRELRHCRSLPENDEMLRLLRAMQFLVLLIEQAPGRVAEERVRLDKLLAGAIDSVSRMSATSETWHNELQRRLRELPLDIASGIRPEEVARQINENLRQEFVRSTIPQTAEHLRTISEQMKSVCLDFSKNSDTIGQEYRGAAEDARKAAASLKTEISQAAETAARFTNEVAEKSTKLFRWSMIGLTGGALVIGLAMGMMFERWLFMPPPQQLVQPAAAKIEAAPPEDSPAPAPAPKAPAAPKAEKKETQE